MLLSLKTVTNWDPNSKLSNKCLYLKLTCGSRFNSVTVYNKKPLNPLNDITSQNLTITGSIPKDIN